MSSKFLDSGSGGGDLSALQNGSFEANLGTLAVDSLTPNDLVRANADKKLISTLVEPSDLNFSVLTNPLAAELVADGVQVTAGNTLKTNTIQATSAPTDIVQCPGGLTAVGNITSAVSIAPIVSVSTLQEKNGNTNILLDQCGFDLQTTGDIIGVQELQSIGVKTDGVGTIAGTGSVAVSNDLNLSTNAITNVGSLTVDSITINDTAVTSTGFLEFVSGGVDRVAFKSAAGILSLENANIGGDVNVELAQFGGTNFNLLKGTGVVDFCAEGADSLEFTTDCQVSNKKVILNPTTDTMLVRDYGLDMNENSITNAGGLTLAASGVNTVYVLKAADLGTPTTHYTLADNTTYIVCGQITLLYGIEFGANCSLRGIDFSAQITFDESARDCDIKAVDNNFYLSQLTIVNGGGRFSSGGRGLLNAQNYDATAAAPFYGRNKRFKVTNVNIIRPYIVGTVEGYGTLNFTNNFVNGGGGLAGQASTYYTNEGISVSDGLSLEFNNNKMVLFAGAQQVSTAKLLNMKARTDPLLGFNAVTVTGNIFHPRGTETGIDFDADSRTKLGNISGNVFIRFYAVHDVFGSPMEFLLVPFGNLFSVN